MLNNGEEIGNCTSGNCGSCGKEDHSGKPNYPHSLPALINYLKRQVADSEVTDKYDLLFNVFFFLFDCKLRIQFY